MTVGGTVLAALSVLFLLDCVEASSCTGGEVYKGQSANVTCHFDRNLSITKESFFIGYRPLGSEEDEDALSCNWKGMEDLLCTSGPGFTFNTEVSNKVTLSIRAANNSHVGRYYCALVSQRSSRVVSCRISLKGITTSAATAGTSRTPPKKPETADTEGPTTAMVVDTTTTTTTTTNSTTMSGGTTDGNDKNNTGGGSVGLIVTVIIITVVLVLAIVLIVKKRDWLMRTWQQLRTRHPSKKDEEMKAIPNGTTPPAEESESMLEDSHSQLMMR